MKTLCVIAGKMPIDLLVEKREALFNIRRGQDAKVGNVATTTEVRVGRKQIVHGVNNMWQNRWNFAHKGRAKYTYLRDVETLRDTTRHNSSYFCTQALTGHGNFGSYFRWRRLGADEFRSCGVEEDTVAHFVIKCPEFDPQREALRLNCSGRKVEHWPQVAEHFVSTPEKFYIF